MADSLAKAVGSPDGAGASAGPVGQGVPEGVPAGTVVAGGSLGLVLAIFAESMLSPAGMHLVAPSLPLMQAEFANVPYADMLVPMVVTLPGLMIALCAPFMGALGDKVGVRPLLLWSIVAYLIIGIMPYWLDSLYAIIGARFVFGAAESALAVCGTPLIAAAFIGERRRKMIGGRVAFIGLASMGLAMCGGWAAESGWRAAYLLYLFAIVPLILVLFFVPRSLSIVIEDQGGKQPPQLWAIYALNLVYGAGIAAVFVYAAFLLKEIGIHTPKLAGSLGALGAFTTIAAALAFPFIARLISGRLVVILSFLLMAVGCLMLSMAAGAVAVAAGLVVTAIGMGLFIPTTTEMLLHYSLPQRRGQATGMGLMSIYLGNFLMPFGMTAVTRAGMTIGYGYMLMSGMFVVTTVIGVAMARTIFAGLHQGASAAH